MINVHKITVELEEEICRYTGAPYCVCVDNESNALFMALKYEDVKGKEITIPSHTYPSVPCEIINAGGKVLFDPSPEYLKGEYQLKPTRVWDSALRFTTNMYRAGQFQCVSFTGQWKRLKTIKGGAILTDDYQAYLWFKRFRFSGRRECSYFDDNFDMIGHNYTLPHVLASIGLQMITGFYNYDGTPIDFPDLELKYPDLSKYEIYTKVNR
jgi:dTDP-4-amino-4,6-dideoxygalactose transaminase